MAHVKHDQRVAPDLLGMRLPKRHGLDGVERAGLLKFHATAQAGRFFAWVWPSRTEQQFRLGASKRCHQPDARLLVLSRSRFRPWPNPGVRPLNPAMRTESDSQMPGLTRGTAIGAEVKAIPVLELRPQPTKRIPWFKEVWSFRGVIGILARKDFQVRYKRASFGLAWAVVIPLIQAIVFVIIFSRVGHFSDLKFSYPAYVLSGTLAWSYFSTAATSGSTSIVDSNTITDKVWFPRSVLVLVPVISNMFSLITSMILLIVALPLVHAHITWRLLLLVPAFIFLIVFTTAFNLVTSALHVYFRDVRYIVIAGLLLAFYLTPIVYPASALHSIAPLLIYNPMTGIIGLFQLAAAGPFGPMLQSLLVSFAFTVALLVIGAEANRRRDRLFVDQL